VDRFYHRVLTKGEVAGLEGAMKAVPLRKLSKAAVQVAATEAAGQGSTGGSALERGETGAVADTRTAGETPAVPVESAFRVTFADGKGGETVEMKSLGEAAGPGVIGLVEGFCRDEGNAFACTYSQPIPATARVLFAEPHRRVMGIWTEGEELRAAIARGEGGAGEPEWFAFKEGKWEVSEKPPEPLPGSTPGTGATRSSLVVQAATTAASPSGASASAPSTQVVRPEGTSRAMKIETYALANAAVVPASTRPATGPAATAAAPMVVGGGQSATEPATETSPFSNPGMLPEEESWWTEPGGNFTTVWHYFPVSERNSLRRGFVVPTFVFDDAHAAINLSQKMLYILHDGHLIALPIPAAAFGRK